jgi:hypothetical protein
MFAWKTDPIYRLVFQEVESLWRRVREANAREASPYPEAFRIEEHSADQWQAAAGATTLKNVWIYDDAGPRLFPGLRRVPHDRGSRQGDAWQFGLIRFCIWRDGNHVVIFHDVGPGNARESRFRVETPGEPTELVAENARE